MAKELPYFKFYVNEWFNGDITLENYDLQGVFINICAYYWSKDCEIEKDNLFKKFRNEQQQIEKLIDSNIIKVKNNKVVISFLNEQLQSKEVQTITNRKNGLLGGRPKKEKTEKKPNGFNFANRNESETITQTKANDNPNETNIKESKVKEIKEEKCVRPSIIDVINFFFENSYSSKAANKAFKLYNDQDWKDTKGNIILDWQAKMINVWFKPENEIVKGYSPNLTN